MADTPTLIDQTLHGYGHGHELLAASTSLDNPTANLLSHNSDSAPNTSVSDGPFLTGYPLPDGRYVIARTWADEKADRPNTVITFSVILPAGVSSSFSMERLLEHLARPPEPANRTLPPIDIKDLIGSPLQLSPDEATVAAEFYARPGPIHSTNRSSRERIALALWQQLWRSARYGLQFCTAPDTGRFGKTRERSLRFQSDPITPVVNTSPTCITDDLQNPGPFREFAHFVGSGERSVGLMRPFAEIYTRVTAGTLTPDGLAGILTEYKGNEPRRLRRLKRRITGFQRGEAAWRIERFDLLEALATHELGNMIYASDASLDRWLRFCWDTDPRRTVDILRSVTGDLAAPAGPPSAREGLLAVFEANAPQLLSPNTVAIAATLHRDAVLRTIWVSNDPALWAAWAELDQPIDVPYGDPATDFDWGTVLRAVRENSQALSRILRHYPEALDHLIQLAEINPQPTDLSLDLTADAKRLIRFRLEHDADHLSALARLADDRNLPRALQSDPWIGTVKSSKDEVVHAIGYLIARNSGVAASEVAVQTFARLFRILSGDGGTAAWERLGRQIRGDRGTWDRCARITEDFVHLVRSYPPGQRVEALTALRTANPSACNAVEERIRSEVGKEKRKKFRIWDPTTW